MDAVTADRRRVPRLSPHDTAWRDAALLRPGQEVRLVNISAHGALVESASRLRPGLRAELHLTGLRARIVIAGRVDRCEIARLDPVRYHGAIVFDERAPVGGAAMTG